MGSQQEETHISHVCKPLTKTRVKDSKNPIPFFGHGKGSRGDKGISPRYESSNLQELRVSQHHMIDVQLWDDQWSGKSDILHENVVHFHNDLYKEAIEAADQLIVHRGPIVPHLKREAR